MSDVEKLEVWLRCPLTLRPFGLRSEDGVVARLPWIYAEVLKASEELRSVLLSTMRMDWGKTLPVIPPTKEEVKDLIKNKQNRDELMVIRILATLSSESTNTITNLEISREMVKTALAGLRDNHKAQINLLNILSGTRFKYPFHGVLVPTCCQNIVGERECGAEDSFEHMMQCYSICVPTKKGPEYIDFMVNLAVKTLHAGPGGPKPMFII